MSRGHKDSNNDKISPAFKARLDRMNPREKVGVLVVLNPRDTDGASGRRQSPAERQAAIDAMRKSVEPALAEIDRVLELFGGKPLAPHVNALGSVPVETTAEGITALADLEPVKSILEDQPISLLSNSKR
jgi:hypothetical protein